MLVTPNGVLNFGFEGCHAVPVACQLMIIADLLCLSVDLSLDSDRRRRQYELGGSYVQDCCARHTHTNALMHSFQVGQLALTA